MYPLVSAVVALAVDDEPAAADVLILRLFITLPLVKSILCRLNLSKLSAISSIRAACLSLVVVVVVDSIVLPAVSSSSLTVVGGGGGSLLDLTIVIVNDFVVGITLDAVVVVVAAVGFVSAVADLSRVSDLRLDLIGIRE